MVPHHMRNSCEIKKAHFGNLKKISVQTDSGFFTSQILWFPSGKVEGAQFEAGVIKDVLPLSSQVTLYSLWDGRMVREPYHTLYKSQLKARQFPAFVTEVMRANLRKKYFKQIVPGRTRPEMVTTTRDRIDTRDRMGYPPHPPRQVQNPITTRLPPARSPSAVELTSRNKDAARDVYQGQKQEPFVETTTTTEEEETTSGTYLLVLGAAGVILFLATR